MSALSAQINAPWPQLLLLLLLSFAAHEAGHLLVLAWLRLPGKISGGGLGLAVGLPPRAQGWRGALAALGGPLVNIGLLFLALRLGWQSLAQVNFVLAAVNLLPFLPLDGGRVLLGLFSGLLCWRRLAAALLFWGRAAAIALAISVYYFGLTRWLLPLALWLYLLAMREDKRLAYLHNAALTSCAGQSLRPPRVIFLFRDRPLYRVIRLLSPGWRDLLYFRGVWLAGDELVEHWQRGAGAAYLSELIKKYPGKGAAQKGKRGHYAE